MGVAYRLHRTVSWEGGDLELDDRPRQVPQGNSMPTGRDNRRDPLDPEPPPACRGGGALS